MSILPGWSSIEAASAIAHALHVTAIVVLGLLFVSEGLALIYDTRKDDLVTARDNLRRAEQSEAQGRHSAETATLRGQLEAARAAAQPRHLLPQQQQKLMTIARSFPETKINVYFEVGDREGYDYAMDFLKVFQEAGWTTYSSQCMCGGPPLYGVELAAFQDDINRMRPPPALNPLFETLMEWHLIDRLDGTSLGEAGSIVLRIGKKPS